MNIKEIKDFKKNIDKSLRDNNNQGLTENIETFLSRIKSENGKDRYVSELEQIYRNIRRFYIDKGEDISPIFYRLGILLSNIYIEDKNIERAEEVLLGTISIVKDKDKIEEIKQSSINEFQEIRTALVKVEALRCIDGKEQTKDIVKKIKTTFEEVGFQDFNEYELFLQMSNKLAIKDLKGNLLKTQESQTPRVQRGEKIERTKNHLPYYLLPVNRLNFLIKEFPNIEIRQGNGKFSDYLVFEIPGEESIIVEKFFRKDKNGNIRIAEGEDATYILPKEYILDLLEVSKSDIREFAKIDERIKVVNHRSGTQVPIPEDSKEIPYDLINYYRRFKTKFNVSVGHEYFSGFGFNDKETIRLPKPTNKSFSRKPKKQTQKSESDTSKKINEKPSESIEMTDSNNTNSTDERTDLITKLNESIKQVENYTKLLEEARKKGQKTEVLKRKLIEETRNLENLRDKLYEDDQK